MRDMDFTSFVLSSILSLPPLEIKKVIIKKEKVSFRFRITLKNKTSLLDHLPASECCPLRFALGREKRLPELHRKKREGLFSGVEEAGGVDLHAKASISLGSTPLPARAEHPWALCSQSSVSSPCLVPPEYLWRL